MLKVVASADLGGLGAKEGPPVAYDWMRASMLPVALPWLAILLLLVFKPNRFPRAWWILAPLACLTCGIGYLPDIWPSMPSQLDEVLHDLVVALAFGVAAVWLLSAYLKSRFRILNVLGSLLVLEVFSFVDLCIHAGLERSRRPGDRSLCWSCPLRRLHSSSGGPGRIALPQALSSAGLCGGMLVMLLGLWMLVLLPLFLIQTVAAGQNVPASAVVAPVLVITGLCFGVLLPFLLLSFLNSLFRERLIQLLRLAPDSPPPRRPG